MAQLTPLLSTTQESALWELLTQMENTQAQKVLIGGSSIYKIIDNLQVNFGSDTVAFSGSLQIESTQDTQGRTIVSAKVVWT